MDSKVAVQADIDLASYSKCNVGVLTKDSYLSSKLRLAVPYSLDHLEPSPRQTTRTATLTTLTAAGR